MTTINDLAIEYKVTKSNKLLEVILKKLNRVIKVKASYIFYRQLFRMRGITFNLYKSKIVDLEDVRQELTLFTMKLLESFDGKRDFKKYYFTSIWKWRPVFLNKGVYLRLKEVQEVPNEMANSYSLVDSIKPSEDKTNINLDDILNTLSTKEEKNVIRLMYLNPTMKFIDVAKELKYSPSKVTRIVQGIKKNKVIKRFLKSLLS